MESLERENSPAENVCLDARAPNPVELGEGELQLSIGGGERRF